MDTNPKMDARTATDAKRIRADIVFLLDKAEQEEAAIGAGGVERLRSDAPAAVKPPASQRDELLQVALDFIGTLTGMSPPPIEVAPPEVFAPFYDFVDRVQAITSAAPAAPADALDALTQAARDVLAERQRQISVNGWTPEHDDSHDGGELSCAAAGYAIKASDQIQCVAHQMDESTLDDDVSSPNSSDPWPHGWQFKPCSSRRALVKSAALSIAEIERIDRAAIAAQAAQKNGGT